MTGEDFASSCTGCPGAFVWIGNGPAEGGRELHHPNYDFNDAVLPPRAASCASRQALAGRGWAGPSTTKRPLAASQGRRAGCADEGRQAQGGRGGSACPSASPLDSRNEAGRGDVE
jgi:hypothetical protein